MFRSYANGCRLPVPKALREAGQVVYIRSVGHARAARNVRSPGDSEVIAITSFNHGSVGDLYPAAFHIAGLPRILSNLRLLIVYRLACRNGTKT
jgi:hypothetical protein